MKEKGGAWAWDRQGLMGSWLGEGVLKRGVTDPESELFNGDG